MDYEDIINFPGTLGHWIYELYSVEIPVLGISLWLLTCSILVFTFLLRALDPLTHRSQGFSQDQNNNRIYRER